jgi:hypothetical protein
MPVRCYGIKRINKNNYSKLDEGVTHNSVWYIFIQPNISGISPF